MKHLSSEVMHSIVDRLPEPDFKNFSSLCSWSHQMGHPRQFRHLEFDGGRHPAAEYIVAIGRRPGIAKHVRKLTYTETEHSGDAWTSFQAYKAGVNEKLGDCLERVIQEARWPPQYPPLQWDELLYVRGLGDHYDLTLLIALLPRLEELDVRSLGFYDGVDLLRSMLISVYLDDIKHHKIVGPLSNLRVLNIEAHYTKILPWTRIPTLERIAVHGSKIWRPREFLLKDGNNAFESNLQVLQISAYIGNDFGDTFVPILKPLKHLKRFDLKAHKKNYDQGDDGDIVDDLLQTVAPTLETLHLTEDMLAVGKSFRLFEVSATFLGLRRVLIADKNDRRSKIS